MKVTNIPANPLILVLLLMILFLAQPSEAQITDEIDTLGHDPYRILPGVQPNENWIVVDAFGLLRLSEDQEGNWTVGEYPLSYIHDACGPDLSGKIYASFRNTGQSGVYVFNATSRIIEDTILVGTDYVVTGLTLSDDESKLYLLGWDWPRVGGLGSSAESSVHRDSGIVWEIDLATRQVTDQGIVGGWPETVIYTENDTLLIYPHEKHYLFDVGPDTTVTKIDIVSTSPNLARITQIQTLRNLGPYFDEFVRWSDEDPLVAMFASELDITQLDNYEYQSGIWIINTATNQVVQTIKVFFEEGWGESPVYHGTVSSVYPGRAYVTTAVGVQAIDKATGANIEVWHLPMVYPMFVHEMPDGRLIVTTGESEKIYIIDPSE